MRTSYGPEPRYYVNPAYSGLRFGLPTGGPEINEYEIAPEFVDPDVRHEGVEWLSKQDA